MFKDRKDKSTVVGDRSGPATPGEGFLERWSRRKAVARTQQQEEKIKQPSAEESGADVPLQAEAVPPVEQKTDADMPPLDALDENSEYGAFLSPRVSDKLRRLALRKLFHMPAFNIRDGLDDYDEDYTTFEALGNVITADMRHQMEREQEKARRRLAEEQGAEPAETAAEPVEAQAAEPEEEARPSDVAARDSEPDSAATDEANSSETDKDEPPSKG